MATSTEILAPGTTDAVSAPFTVASGSVTLSLVPAAGQPIAGGSILQIEQQQGADWVSVDTISGRTGPAVQFHGLGTYRIHRAAQAVAVGCRLVVP